MGNMDFPLVISVGGSQQSKKWYSENLQVSIEGIKLCGDLVADHFHGHHMNLALPGASNRRHIRRTMLECMKELQLNPSQQKIVIFELSFLLRKEVWIDQYVNTDNLDGNFLQIQLASDLNWWQKRTNTKDARCIDGKELDGCTKKSLHDWIKTQRTLYSPYAETVNLYQDLIMFSHFLKYHAIKYVIFNGNPCEHLESTSMLNILHNYLINDKNILDLLVFSLTKWCVDNQFLPLDNPSCPTLGHPSIDAHAAFAHQLLIPILDHQQ